MTAKKEKLKKNKNKILTALAAALAYGGWAVFANYEHGLDIAVPSGLIQGIYAFLSTLTITIVAQKVFVKYNCGIRGVLTGFSLSFVVMLAFPFVVHRLNGTPDIWETILPGLIWGSIYLLGFLVTLEVKQRKTTNSGMM